MPKTGPLKAEEDLFDLSYAACWQRQKHVAVSSVGESVVKVVLLGPLFKRYGLPLWRPTAALQIHH